jgi:hypothetical protein
MDATDSSSRATGRSDAPRPDGAPRTRLCGPSDERDELRRLRKENRILVEEREILEKQRPSSHGKARPGDSLRVHRREQGRTRDLDYVPRPRGLEVRLTRLGDQAGVRPLRRRHQAAAEHSRAGRAAPRGLRSPRIWADPTIDDGEKDRPQNASSASYARAARWW